jgi:uncharacterized protein (DUF2147 family)
MNRKHLLFLLLNLGFTPLTHAGETGDITGLWLTKKQDAAVRVEKCGDEICGHIAWFHADETPYNIEGQPLCHAQVLSGFKTEETTNNQWSGGTVYKADDNKIYSGNLKLVDQNTLELRAYIGLPALGKTKTLTRTSAQNYPPCTIPAQYAARKLQNIAPASGAND